jgi:hypothetical protein
LQEDKPRQLRVLLAGGARLAGENGDRLAVRPRVVERNGELVLGEHEGLDRVPAHAATLVTAC